MSLKRPTLAGFLILINIMLCSSVADAQDAMWLGASGDWNLASNWSPAIQPSGTAIFDSSGNVKSVTFSAATTSIGTMQFNSAGSDYAFTIASPSTNQTLAIGGMGITGSSPNPTFFVSSYPNQGTQGTLQFSGASGAGSAVITNNSGIVDFIDTSSAQSAMISTADGITRFRDSATAGNATLVDQSMDISGSPVYGNSFYNSSTAANAHITTSGGGAVVAFHDSSTAGAATITSLDFSTVEFFDTSSAGNASIAGSGSEQVVIPGTETLVNGPTNEIRFYNSSNAGNANLGRSFLIAFGDTSSAGSATILNDVGDGLVFHDYSTAANATITTASNGYQTSFLDNSNGGEARFIDVGTAVLNFSTTAGPQNNNGSSGDRVGGFGGS